MPTTSNFGWTTPADTDLVKDGAAAIRTLGNGIDTSLVDLKGGTTGQVLSKNSNTDLDFTWVAQDDSDAIQNAIVDAKGDLITATAADTPARLASSAVNGDVLTVDTSTATGLKWATPSAGAYTLISTTTLTTTSHTLSSIPSTYRDLYIVMRSTTSVTQGDDINFRFNADSTANRHQQLDNNDTKNSGQVATTFSRTNGNIQSGVPLAGSTASITWIYIPDYANTATWKFANVWGVTVDSTTTTSFRSRGCRVMYNQTGAISSLEFFSGQPSNLSGTILLYGVK